MFPMQIGGKDTFCENANEHKKKTSTQLDAVFFCNFSAVLMVFLCFIIIALYFFNSYCVHYYVTGQRLISFVLFLNRPTGSLLH